MKESISVSRRNPLGVVTLLMIVSALALIATSGRQAVAADTPAPDSTAERHRLLIELHPRPVFPAISDVSRPLWKSAQPDELTEIEIMKSDAVLKNVVRELDLVKAAGKTDEEEATLWLRQILSLDSDAPRLIELSVWLPKGLPGKKISARRLARGVADGYKNYSEEQSHNQSKRLLEELQLESKAQEKLMERSRVAYLDLLHDVNLTDLAGRGEEIETPLMRGVREGAVKVTKEVAKELSDERRRGVEAQAAKDEYHLHASLLAQLREVIARASIATKMPQRVITVHD